MFLDQNKNSKKETKMFGNPMRIEMDGFGVTLRPHKKEELEKLAELYSSMNIQWYIQGTGAMTLEQEIEWWKHESEAKDSVIWAIVPDGSDTAVGSTGLHKIHPLWGSCTSGIVIADRKYWGKGVAYRAHLMRTFYAAEVLNRMTIQSKARVENEASVKALLKVGYRVSGKYDRDVFRQRYIDTYVLSWVHPGRAASLYPEGVPEELNVSLKLAWDALEVASDNVKYL